MTLYKPEIQPPIEATIIHPASEEMVQLSLIGRELKIGSAVVNIGTSAANRIIIEETFSLPNKLVTFDQIKKRGLNSATNVTRAVNSLNGLVLRETSYHPWEAEIGERISTRPPLVGVTFSTQGFTPRETEDEAGSAIYETPSMYRQATPSVNVKDIEQWSTNIKLHGSYGMAWMISRLNPFETAVLHQLITNSGVAGASITSITDQLREARIHAIPENVARSLGKIHQLSSSNDSVDYRLRIFRVKADNPHDSGRFAWSKETKKNRQ